MKHDIQFFEDEHLYLVNGTPTPSVTEILSAITSRGYSKVNPSVLEYAANRGKAAHEALQLLDYGADPEIVPEIVPYIQAYEEWKSIYRPTWTDIEQIVYEEELEYIGTLDRAGYLNGREFAIVDIKTSNATRESLVAACAQTAAYAMAYPGKVEISRYILFLRSDGSFRFQNCTEWESKNNFSGYDVWLKLLENYKLVSKLLETKGRKK